MENNNLENQNLETTAVNTPEEQKTLGEGNKEKIPAKKNITRLILTIILVASIVFIGYLAFKKLTFKEVIDLNAIPTYNITHIKIGQMEKEYEANGVIAPNDTYYVVSKVGGDIKKIHVKNGDRVKKGDPICDIDASKEIEAAFIEYDTAKKNYERMQKLFAAGDISQQSFEQVKALYDGKKLAYDTKVEYSNVVAVGDGVIENTDMIVNTAISAGKVLCYITSNEAKEINFGVTERVLDGISVGDKVTIEKSGIKYDGRVSNVSKLVNTTDGLFHQKAVILSKNNFATGVNAKVTFVYDRRVNTQILPNDAISYEAGQAYIFVVDDKNVLRKKYIDVGMQNEHITEVLTKIDKKEKIVATWTKDLAEGSQAKIGIDEEVVDDIVKETTKEAIIETRKENIDDSLGESEIVKEEKRPEDPELKRANDVINELGGKLGIIPPSEKDVKTKDLNETKEIEEKQSSDNSKVSSVEIESVKVSININALGDNALLNGAVASFSEVK